MDEHVVSALRVGKPSRIAARRSSTAQAPQSRLDILSRLGFSSLGKTLTCNFLSGRRRASLAPARVRL
jgi:hypothetical protein